MGLLCAIPQKRTLESSFDLRGIQGNELFNSLATSF